MSESTEEMSDEKDAGMQIPPPNPPDALGAGLVDVVGEDTPPPKYDFGSGEMKEKVERVKEELAKRGLLPQPAEGTSEPQPPDHPAPPEAGQLLGKDVDWNKFELDSNFAHFYPQAQFTVTGVGPKWVVVIDEFASWEKSYNRMGVDGKGDPAGLGAFITSKVNSPPDSGCGPWKLAALLPGTMGNGAVVLTRKVPIVLPDPRPLETETKVDEPTEDELKEVDDAAAAWAEQVAKDAIDGPEVEPRRLSEEPLIEE